MDWIKDHLDWFIGVAVCILLLAAGCPWQALLGLIGCWLLICWQHRINERHR